MIGLQRMKLKFYQKNLSCQKGLPGRSGSPCGRRQAGLFDQDGMDFARTMHAANQDLLDIGGAAPARDENYKPSPRPLGSVPRQTEHFSEPLQRTHDPGLPLKRGSVAEGH